MKFKYEIEWKEVEFSFEFDEFISWQVVRVNGSNVIRETSAMEHRINSDNQLRLIIEDAMQRHWLDKKADLMEESYLDKMLWERNA